MKKLMLSLFIVVVCPSMLFAQTQEQIDARNAAWDAKQNSETAQSDSDLTAGDRNDAKQAALESRDFSEEKARKADDLEFWNDEVDPLGQGAIADGDELTEEAINHVTDATDHLNLTATPNMTTAEDLWSQGEYEDSVNYYFFAEVGYNNAEDDFLSSEIDYELAIDDYNYAEAAYEAYEPGCGGGGGCGCCTARVGSEGF